MFPRMQVAGFKEAQAVQPGKSGLRVSKTKNNGMLQRGPGRSAREISKCAESAKSSQMLASKRPRPFSPGNWYARSPPRSTRTRFKEAQAVQPGKFARRGDQSPYIAQLQRGPGRSAREIRPRDPSVYGAGRCFKEAQAVQPGKSTNWT